MISKILVIEDEPSVREAVSFILERNGYEVTASPNGEAGLAAFAIERPDLVICDIMMPIMGGFQFLEELRALPAGAELPVILLTAKDRDEDIRRGYDHGADYYLTKPFTQSQLLAGVRMMSTGRAA